MTCGPIPGEAFPPGVAICPQRHVTGEGRSATIRAAGTFTLILYPESARNFTPHFTSTMPKPEEFFSPAPQSSIRRISSGEPVTEKGQNAPTIWMPL